MDREQSSSQGRQVLLSAAILVAGLLLAGFLYWRAEAREQAQRALELSTMGMSPEYSKRFVHDLQLYGGKANVLAFQLRAWLADFFGGKPLAYLVALLALAGSLASYWLSRHGGLWDDSQEEDQAAPENQAPGP